MKDESNAKKAMNSMTNVERQVALIEHQKAFIDAYPKEGTIGKAMRSIGMARTTFYKWIRDPEFNAVYQELKQDRIDELVTRLYTFILDTEAPKINQQQLLAAFFLLKAFDPKTFTEKMQMQHIGGDGAPAKVDTIEIHRAVNPNDAEVTDDADSREISSSFI